MSANINLNKARVGKNDEFYTQLKDVSKELMYYRHHFKDKVVLCNCNDSEKSAFWQYFHLNFEFLGLKKLISTTYSRDISAYKSAYKMEYTGGNDSNIEVGVITPLEGNGDFRNQECLDLFNESDIVVTNPPFSLFCEYVDVLMEYEKKFLIIGSLNAVKYSECFPFIMNNRMWLGNNNVHEFLQPDWSFKKFGNVNWYTNLDFVKRHEKIVLWKQYNDRDYPKYETYDAIEVSKVTDIPVDYDGIMGVPVSFMSKYNPDQFEIVGEFNHGSDNKFGLAKPIVNGKELFPRIAIRLRTNMR